MPRKISKKGLEAKLDRVFSEYIRRRDSDGNTGACVTCGKLLFWKDGHCGHFIKRQHRSTRWLATNAALQCPGCNTYRGGCQDEFAAHILRTYGRTEFNRLMSMKHQAVKHTRGDLENMIAGYVAKLTKMDCKEMARLGGRLGDDDNWNDLPASKYDRGYAT